MCCQTHRFPREWALRTRAKIGSPSLEEKYQESEARVDFAHATKSRRRPAYCSYVKKEIVVCNATVSSVLSWTVYRTESCQATLNPHTTVAWAAFVVMICQLPRPWFLFQRYNKGCWRLSTMWIGRGAGTYFIARPLAQDRESTDKAARVAWTMPGNLQICSH